MKVIQIQTKAIGLHFDAQVPLPNTVIKGVHEINAEGQYDWNTIFPKPRGIPPSVINDFNLQAEPQTSAVMEKGAEAPAIFTTISETVATEQGVINAPEWMKIKMQSTHQNQNK